MLHYEHLVGVPFDHGVHDCYSLARSFFFDNFEIQLTNYARPDDWELQGMDLYNENFAREGFEVVDISIKELRPADVLLMALRSQVANHCAIYVGNGNIVHHMFGKFSCVERFRHHNSTTHMLRHKKVRLSQEPVEQVDAMTLISSSKRKMLEEVADARAAKFLQR